MTGAQDPTGLLPLVVVADDLTGAMDSGLQFACRGIETVVQLSSGDLAPAPAVALSTESRDLSASEAIARVRAVVPRLSGRHLFKKIDSTLRGNIGYELRAMLDLLPIRAFVVAPAFPQGGRTTVEGEQRVGGTALTLTAFRNDPRWPMREAHIPTYLMQQAGTEVGGIPLVTVARGEAAIAGALAGKRERIVVADAASDDDLAVIAAAVHSLGPGWVPCGSAGLAQAWAGLMGGAGIGAEPVAPRRGPGLLFVIGSRNPVTLAQMEALVAGGAARVSLRSLSSYDPAAETDRLAIAVGATLGRGVDTVLEASSAALVPGGGPRVAAILAGAVRAAVSRGLVGGLFLTGGEIALAACHGLGVQALRVRDAIEPGIPGGQLVGGLADGLPAATKAGGFGSPRALLAARDWLRSSAAPAEWGDSQEE